jgi:hypothetical protein
LLYIGRPAISTFCRALTNEVPWVRARAAKGLYELHDSQVVRWSENPSDSDCDRQTIVPLLLDRIVDQDERVRSAAISALFRISATTPETTPMIISAWSARLDDLDPLVRRFAAEAVFRCGTRTEAMAPKLIKALDDPDKDVREKAAAALRRVSSLTVWTNLYPDLMRRVYTAESFRSLVDRSENLPNDLELGRKLAGTWASGHTSAKGDRMNGTLIISVDGTFVSRFTLSGVNRDTWHYESEGTWQVIDGVWIASGSGSTDHDRIINVSEHELVLESEGIESNGILVHPLGRERIVHTRIK